MSSLSRAASRLMGRGASAPFRSLSVSAAPRGDAVPTHTGMQFSEDDPRCVFFFYSVIYLYITKKFNAKKVCKSLGFEELDLSVSR
jgi:hypothetical protein